MFTVRLSSRHPVWINLLRIRDIWQRLPGSSPPSQTGWILWAGLQLYRSWMVSFRKKPYSSAIWCIRYISTCLRNLTDERVINPNAVRGWEWTRGQGTDAWKVLAADQNSMWCKETAQRWFSLQKPFYGFILVEGDRISAARSLPCCKVLEDLHMW